MSDLSDLSAVPPPMPMPTSIDGHAEAKRLQRLADGVRGLRTGGGTLKLNERVLMILAGVVAPLGLILVLLGWWGAAHTPNDFEQVPYLISGGLLGLGLVFLGGFFYFAHWLTELVREHRTQSAAVVEAITRLEEVITRTAAVSASNGTGAASPARTRPLSKATPDVALVATERGTMAHRPECVVVAGKTGLRPVTATEGLASCKLCDPYTVAAN